MKNWRKTLKTVQEVVKVYMGLYTLYIIFLAVKKPYILFPLVIGFIPGCNLYFILMY